MKKISILLLISLIFVGCFHFPYGNTISLYDDFKKENRKSVLFNESFNPIKTNFPGLNRKRSFIFKFENIVLNKSDEKNHLVFSFDLAPNEFIDTNFFIMVDQELHALIFYDNVSTDYIHRSENLSTTTNTKTSTENVDGNSLQSRSDDDKDDIASTKPKTITKTEVEVKNEKGITETTRKKLVNKAYLPKDLVDKIAKSQQLKLRIYLNERGFTYVFSQANMDKLKQFYLLE